MHASTEQLIALRDSEPVDAAVVAHVRDCAPCATHLNEVTELRHAFARLPDFAVPEGAWERIARSLAEPQPVHHWHAAGRTALAACVIFAVVLATLRLSPPSAPGGSDYAGTQASVPQLMQQSRYLERAVLSLNANADHLVISAGTAATVAALEDRIALLDYEINRASAGRQGRERLPQLWQQRVNLLQSLAAVRYAQVASSSI